MGNNIRKQMTLGVIFSYLLIVMKLLVGVVYTPILLRLLGQSQYGIYSLSVSVVGYLTILDAGANAAYIKFYVQAKTNDKASVSSYNMFFLLFFATFATIATFVGLLISKNASFVFGSKISENEYELIKKCLNYLSYSIFFEVFGCLWRSMIIANEKFAFVKFLNLIVYISVPVISIPLLLMGYDCSSILIIRLIIRIAEFLIESIFCLLFLKERFSFRGIDRTMLFMVLNFISFIVLQSIMDQLNWQIDKLILSHTHGTNEISVYSVGTTFNNIYKTISASLAGVFIAKVNKLVALQEDKELNVLFIKTSRLCTYVVLIIMVEYILMGKAFVCRWVGENYIQSFYVGLLLMLPLTFALCVGVGQDITRAKNKHRMQILMDFSVCIINTILSIPLAIKWGAVGGAVGTFCSEVILCCVIQPIYYQKVVGLNMLETFKQLLPILKSCVLPIIYGTVIHLLKIELVNYRVIVMHGSIIVILYLLSIYFFSFNEYEKKIFSEFTNKIRIGKK